MQDPDDAVCPGMPRNALHAVDPDYVGPLVDIPQIISNVVRGASVRVASPRERRPTEQPGPITGLTCPECHGALWQEDEGGAMRFRCRVGHRYSPDTMLAAQDDSVERALWAAVRALEERAALSRRLANLAEQNEQPHSVNWFEQRSRAAEEHALVLRDLILGVDAENRTEEQMLEAPPEPGS